MKQIALRFIAGVALISGIVANAGVASANGTPALGAARLTGPIRVDGRLDDAAWAAAPIYSDFVQSFPAEGERASERTEVRVLYDDRALYVGVRCFDAQPDAIVSPLGRRDHPPGSDMVQVFIDSNHDHRTAALFQITAGGVLVDGLVYDDDRINYDWDEVWEGGAALLPDGWSAEFAIPLAALRYPDVPMQQWGFGVQREIGRSHEKAATVLFPRNGRGLVSRLGHLDGIEGISPRTGLELAPYLAGRVMYRPRDQQQPVASSRMAEPMADVGLDFRARLGPSFQLTGAVNPDFGQVEADQIMLNLSSFEPYLPEKRPFFSHGLDVFLPVGDGNESQVPQQMFYSRRIGLDTPILGAAKLIGRTDRWDVGLLDVAVSGTGRAGDLAADTDRALRWSARQPFRLAPDSAYPTAEPVSRNYLAAVARGRLAERVMTGVQATSALPLARRCALSVEDAAWSKHDVECDAVGGNAAAVDFNATTPDGEWYAYGQAAASQPAGGPTTRILLDGTRLDRNDIGTGAFVRMGRRGGEPWRGDVYWAYSDPRLDLNPLGFQKSQNLQEVRGYLRYTRPAGGGPFHEYTVWLSPRANRSTDGNQRDLGRSLYLSADGTLKDLYTSVGCVLEWESGRYDLREISTITAGGAQVGAGAALQRPGWSGLECWLNSDPSRAVAIDHSFWAYKPRGNAPIDAPWSWGAFVNFKLRPHPRAETQLGATLDYKTIASRFLPTTLGTDPTAWYFGQLTAASLSFTVRQLVVLTPRLTFQLYGQLFTDYGRYSNFFSSPRGDVVHISDLRPIAPGQLPGGSSLDFREATLVVNAVLRWEYRPGSTLFLVYGRNQARALGDLALPGSSLELAPQGLAGGPASDSLLVKWSYWIGP